MNQSPKQFFRQRTVSFGRLERINERLAEKEERYLTWLHSTKGRRRMSFRRMRYGGVYNALKSNEVSFYNYVQQVAQGVYRKLM